MSDAQGQANEDMLIAYRKEMFALWIREQIDSWLCEYGAWYMWIEDEGNDFDEEDWKWICENLKVTDIEIEET